MGLLAEVTQRSLELILPVLCSLFTARLALFSLYQ